MERSKQITVNVNGGKTEKIVLERSGKGIFRIVDSTIDNLILSKKGNSLHDATELGFNNLASGCEDLDAGTSDQSQCFGISSKVRYLDVIITPGKIEAKSVREIKEAVKHLRFVAWCLGDI